MYNNGQRKYGVGVELIDVTVTEGLVCGARAQPANIHARFLCVGA
jgi:hypothetical protein